MKYTVWSPFPKVSFFANSLSLPPASACVLEGFHQAEAFLLIFLIIFLRYLLIYKSEHRIEVETKKFRKLWKISYYPISKSKNSQSWVLLVLL